MSRDDYPYPEDEFDTLGADRTPQGVHRAPLPRWRQLLPFLIVLVLAPTLAFVAVRAVTGDDGGPGTDPTTASSTTEAATTDDPESGDPESGDGTETTDAEEPTEPESTEETTTPEADLDYSTTIWVLNGSGVSGLAAETVTALEGSGWQDANAADYNRAQPSATTIFYDNADQAEEAQAVGEQLGITNVVESSDAAAGDIVVVIRSDFTLP